MKLLILGSGLMGPAAAYNAMANPAVRNVTLCDQDKAQLATAARKLDSLPGSQKLSFVHLDLKRHGAARSLLAGFDVTVSALSRAASGMAIRLAIAAGTPLVDLTRPGPVELETLKQEAMAKESFIILSCGLEPGLTEIMARYLAEKLDRVDELHIQCGGIPETPTPPLGYKIVFGGRHLPLHEGDAYIVEDGQLKQVPRYSGVERTVFPGVGECEAWHEGFMPWLLELPALRNLKHGTQKTVRWPGYAAKATLLKELGLLSTTPIEVDGVLVRPKHVLDAVLYPQVQLSEQERDITTFRVSAIGELLGQQRRYTVQMVDRYDEKTGLTAMARTTAFTGTIVACMIGSGELTGQGVVNAEQVVNGPFLKRLIDDLADHGIRFEITSEKTELLGSE